MTDAGGNIEDADYCQPERRQRTPTRSSRPRSTRRSQPPALPIAATSPAIDVADCGGRTLDQRGLARPQGARCDAGAFESPEQRPQPPPTQTPDADADPDPEPTPVVNQTVVVTEVKGTVKVKLPGTNRFIDLDATRGIPVGSTVDTKKGTVELTSIPKAGAPAETARFYDGIFRVTQSNGITNLTLIEALAPCPKRRRATRGHEAEDAPAVGRRQGRVPHQREVQRRDRARHEVARRGLVRRHAHPRHAGLGDRPRQGRKDASSCAPASATSRDRSR